MADRDVAYRESKAAVLRMVAGDRDVWATPVPATPDWTVLDVVRHVTGVAVDAATQTLPADVNLLEQFRDDDVVAARDEFADGQVLRRLDASPADVLAEWDAAEVEVLERLAIDPGGDGALPFPFETVIVTDLAVHADDIAGALDLPPHRDALGARIGLSAYAFGVEYRITALELPPLVLRYDGKERTLGSGEPAATLDADRWELFRVLAGRRSRSQILALDWTGDPTPYLPLLPAYGERADDLVESARV